MSTTDISLLRFATAGSVDDGKSTLIGRLLYDAKGLFEDQRAALEADFDLARMTDGLRAEREQGITIDVAHRYFATERRRFMIADCPGHAEYTRNALTGMSESDVVLLLVDARQGVQTQTRRHARIAGLLGLPVVVCVNKMDIFNFEEAHFRGLEAEIRAALGALTPELHVQPISALTGAHVVHPEPRLSWFEGGPLLSWLEGYRPLEGAPRGGRLFVQNVIRIPGAGRVFAGQIGAGELSVGEEVVLLPRGTRTRIAEISTFDGPLAQAQAPLSVTVRFDEHVDVSRGDLIASAADAPAPVDRLDATVAWLAERPLRPKQNVLLQVGSNTIRAVVESVDGVIDLEGFGLKAAEGLVVNDIGRIRIRSLSPLAVEEARGRPQCTERLTLIDPETKATLSAGLVGAR